MDGRDAYSYSGKPSFGTAFLFLGGDSMLTKPPDIANDEFKSSEYGELAIAQNFRPS